MNVLFHDHYPRRYFALLSVFFYFSALTLNTAGQVREQTSPPKSDSKSPVKSIGKPVDVSRWRSLLDQSKSEANSLSIDEGRAYALAEVADAYWPLDSSVSEEWFSLAMNAVVILKKKNSEEGEAAAGYVLALAGRRSGTLSKSLAKQLTKQNTEETQSKGKSEDEIESAANNLLNSDPKKAAEMIKLNAATGPSMGAAWLIFQITERDPLAGEELYRTYLERFGSGTNRGLEHLLLLAGYPFGYGEAYGGAKDTTQFVGFGGFRIKSLTPKPLLASVFLDLAFQNVLTTLQQAVSSPETESDLLSGLALFVTSYCLPEVGRYRPQTLPAWYSLYQTALNRVTPARKALVAEQIQRLMKTRSATQDKSPEEYAQEQSKETLEQAESLPDGCKRDQAYAQLALNFGYSKDLSSSLEFSRKIKDDALARSVAQYIYYDMAAKSIAAGDAVEGDRFIELVTPDELRTLLHLKMARAVLKRKDFILAAQSIGKALNSAARISQPGTRSSALLSAAEICAAFDPPQALTLLREAVKVINGLPKGRSTQTKVGSTSVLRKVNFECSGAENSWYGTFEEMGRSLFDVLPTLSAIDVEQVLSAAYGLEDPLTRVRAVTSIAKGELARRPKDESKGQPAASVP